LAVLGLLLLRGEAAAQLSLPQLSPGRAIRVTTVPDGVPVLSRQAGTLVRFAADTLHMLSQDRTYAIPRSAITAMDVSLGTRRVIGVTAILGALVGTAVGGGIGYLLVMANDDTTNFWEIGPLVVRPLGAAGFILGGGAHLGKPQPRWERVLLDPSVPWDG